MIQFHTILEVTPVITARGSAYYRCLLDAEYPNKWGYVFVGPEPKPGQMLAWRLVRETYRDMYREHWYLYPSRYKAVGV